MKSSRSISALPVVSQTAVTGSDDVPKLPINKSSGIPLHINVNRLEGHSVTENPFLKGKGRSTGSYGSKNGVSEKTKFEHRFFNTAENSSNKIQDRLPTPPGTFKQPRKTVSNPFLRLVKGRKATSTTRDSGATSSGKSLDPGSLSYYDQPDLKDVPSINIGSQGSNLLARSSDFNHPQDRPALPIPHSHKSRLIRSSSASMDKLKASSKSSKPLHGGLHQDPAAAPSSVKLKGFAAPTTSSLAKAHQSLSSRSNLDKMALESQETGGYLPSKSATMHYAPPRIPSSRIPTSRSFSAGNQMDQFSRGSGAQGKSTSSSALSKSSSIQSMSKYQSIISTPLAGATRSLADLVVDSPENLADCPLPMPNSYIPHSASKRSMDSESAASPNSLHSFSSSRQSFKSISRATRRFISSFKGLSGSPYSLASSSEASLVLAPSTPDIPWRRDDLEEFPSQYVQQKMESYVEDFPDLVAHDYSERREKVDQEQMLANFGSKLSPRDAQEIKSMKAFYWWAPTGSSGEPGDSAVLSTTDATTGVYRAKPGSQIYYRYEVLNRLGKGSFGSVYKCRDHKTGAIVAIKVTNNKPGLQQQALVEASILRTLTQNGSPENHHFLRYLGHFTWRGHFCISTELLGPNLYDLLKSTRYRGVDLPVVKFIARQIATGLEFLSQQGILHCDLKPENILISDLQNCQAKIVDFGSSCKNDRKVYTYIQSRFYRAPEILLGIPYTAAIDMWSLGCIIPELILGAPLFPGDSEADQLACICESIGAPKTDLLAKCSRANTYFDFRGMPLSRRSVKGKLRAPPGTRPLAKLKLTSETIDFLSNILRWEPSSRFTPTDAIFHPFLFEIA